MFKTFLNYINGIWCARTEINGDEIIGMGELPTEALEGLKQAKMDYTYEHYSGLLDELRRAGL